MVVWNVTKAIIRWFDGDTDFFDIVGGVWEENTFVRFLINICLDYVLVTVMVLH